MSTYLTTLRFALSRQANAYGFTLVVWGTGLIATWEIGKPGPADVFCYVGGALVSVSLFVACAFGFRRHFSVEEPARRPFSAMHLPSVPASIAAGWGLSSVVGGPAGFFIAALGAVAVYQALLAAEIAVALR